MARYGRSYTKPIVLRGADGSAPIPDPQIVSPVFPTRVSNGPPHPTIITRQNTLDTPPPVGFPTMFGLIDDFNRADQSPPGGPWASTLIPGGATSIAVISNQFGRAAGGNNGYIVATSFGPDMEIYFKVPVLPIDGNYVALYLRGQSPGTTGWEAYYLVWIKGATTDTWSLRKMVAGVPTTIFEPTSTTLGAGESIGVSIYGSNIRMLKTISSVWQEVATTSDTSIISPGFIGLEIGDTQVRVDDLSGGSIPLPTLPATVVSSRTTPTRGQTITTRTADEAPGVFTSTPPPVQPTGRDDRAIPRRAYVTLAASSAEVWFTGPVINQSPPRPPIVFRTIIAIGAADAAPPPPGEATPEPTIVSAPGARARPTQVVLAVAPAAVVAQAAAPAPTTIVASLRQRARRLIRIITRRGPLTDAPLTAPPVVLHPTKLTLDDHTNSLALDAHTSNLALDAHTTNLALNPHTTDLSLDSHSTGLDLDAQ